MKKIIQNMKYDLPASIVVFFVAVPLCLGIALASGAPLFSGIIAGIIGGIIVGAASGSPLGVSGPAAGLAVIVFSSIQALGGSWTAFLLAVVIAGILQLILGFAKAGFIAYFFPSSVIKGMLTGIGLLIILKQIPEALGWTKDAEEDFTFFQADGENTFSAILKAFDYLSPGALIVTVISLGILILWEAVLAKKHKIFEMLNGPLVAVISGILLNYLFQKGILPFSLNAEQVVNLPVPESMEGYLSQFTFPDISVITNYKVWEIAFVITIVASLETLLCVEATDKLDPYKRITPTNRELKAQGLGNIISGCIGGLPITQVIVRSSANITFGGKTKMSAIYHGFFLLLSSIFLAAILNMLPLATLAAILFVVGYKLAKPSLFKQMYKLGHEQFVPFIVTIFVILFTDLLKGITAGLIVGGFYALWHSYRNSYQVKEIISSEHGLKTYHLMLAEEVSFFNKASVVKALKEIPSHSHVIIDCSKCVSISYDVAELIRDYRDNANRKNITVETIKFIEPIA
jgi:MFS superfamily sulfate permease-like transporter